MTDFSHKIILILDDERVIRSSLSTYLEDYGFIAIAVETGEEALEVVKEKTPDLAIVDLRLPGMSGEEFVIQARAINPELAIIIQTGSVEHQLSQRLKDLGISDESVLTKPVFPIKTFLDKITSLLNLSEVN